MSADTFVAAPVPTSPSSRTGGFATRVLAGKAAYSIDQVRDGSTLAALSPNAGIAVRVSAGKPVVITGWAVDYRARNGASGVAIEIDGRSRIIGSYGSARPDVAKVFHAPSFTNSGYFVKLEGGVLSPGEHRLSVDVGATDGSGFYSAPNALVLDVKRLK